MCKSWCCFCASESKGLAIESHENQACRVCGKGRHAHHSFISIFTFFRVGILLLKLILDFIILELRVNR